MNCFWVIAPVPETPLCIKLCAILVSTKLKEMVRISNPVKFVFIVQLVFV
jgi:hypothetical protein